MNPELAQIIGRAQSLYEDLDYKAGGAGRKPPELENSVWRLGG